MSVLQISLFGKFHVQKCQQPIAGFESRKVQELFCYLILFQDRPHPREVLANLFWDEQHTDQPNRCLRKVIWQLRAALDSQGDPISNRVLMIEPDWLQLNPMADLWLDVTEFEHAFNGIQRKAGDELDLESVQILKDAVNLYRGGLQESWYQDWYLCERERLQQMYLIMLDRLMEHCENKGDYTSGLNYGALILDCERAQERTHRRMMRLHHMAGNRTAALRQYEQCARALDEELGVGPASRTIALYQQIQLDQYSPSTQKLVDIGKTIESTDSSLTMALTRLKYVHGVLSEIQNEIKKDIQSIEQALHENKQ